jgi:triosephosphate isomerase
MAKRSTRRPLVAGNWKMNLDHVESVYLMADLALRIRGLNQQQVDVSVHPPFTDLRSVEGIIGADGLPISLGAQHCSAHDNGAFTGEVSLAMLKRLSVALVIVGHSERRQFFSMTNQDVAATAKAVHEHALTPIICVGETQHERESGVMEEILERQVSEAFLGVGSGLEERTIIAYEPIWAIGTGLAATQEDAQGACAFIRATIHSLRGNAADEVRILYGGSAKPENAAMYAEQKDIDGLLVGGASLEGESFAAIIEAVATCYGFSA